MTLPSSLIGAITLTRYAAGSYVAGEWVPGASSSVSVTGMAHRQTADEDLINRVGGTYQDGFIRLYTNEQVFTADKSAGKLADRVTWLDNVYEIVEVVYMPQLSLGHYRSVCRKVDEKTNGA